MRADLPASRELIVGILAEFGIAEDPEGADRDLADPEIFFNGTAFAEVVEGTEGGILGFVGLTVDQTMHQARLRKLYLAKALRGTGLGRRLLQRAECWAREQGCTTVILETSSRLDRALALYREAGYQPAPACAQSSSCDCDLVLQKVLDRHCLRAVSADHRAASGEEEKRSPTSRRNR